TRGSGRLVGGGDGGDPPPPAGGGEGSSDDDGFGRRRMLLKAGLGLAGTLFVTLVVLLATQPKTNSATTATRHPATTTPATSTATPSPPTAPPPAPKAPSPCHRHRPTAGSDAAAPSDESLNRARSCSTDERTSSACGSAPVAWRNRCAYGVGNPALLR